MNMSIVYWWTNMIHTMTSQYKTEHVNRVLTYGYDCDIIVCILTKVWSCLLVGDIVGRSGRGCRNYGKKKLG